MIISVNLAILNNVLKDLVIHGGDREDFISVLNDYTQAYINGEVNKIEYFIGVNNILKTLNKVIQIKGGGGIKGREGIYNKI